MLHTCVSHRRITQFTANSPPTQIELSYCIVRIRGLCHLTVEIVDTVGSMSRRGPPYPRAHSYRRGHIPSGRYIYRMAWKVPQGTRPVTEKHTVVCSCPPEAINLKTTQRMGNEYLYTTKASPFAKHLPSALDTNMYHLSQASKQASK